MTPADAVLGDALREAGYGRVTPWHVLVLEAWAAQVEAVGLARAYDTRVTKATHVETRLKSDLFSGGIDALHVDAQWEHASRTARREPRLRVGRFEEGLT